MSHAGQPTPRFHLPCADVPRGYVAMVESLGPAIQRLLIPHGVARGMEEASRRGSGVQYARQLLKSLNIRFVVDEADLRPLPRTGATVAVCNHPYGIVEGLILVALLDSIRPDYKLVANFLADGVPEMRGHLILANPFEGPGASRKIELPCGNRWPGSEAGDSWSCSRPVRSRTTIGNNTPWSIRPGKRPPLVSHCVPGVR